MPSLAEPPDEIDVFTGAQTFVESTDRPDRVGATDDGSSGHVRNSGPGCDACGFVTEVEWAVALLVGSQRCRARCADDARCHQRDAVIGEVSEQGREPKVGKRDIGVDERDQRRRDLRQARVAGRTRSAVGRMAQSAEASGGVEPSSTTIEWSLIQVGTRLYAGTTMVTSATVNGPACGNGCSAPASINRSSRCCCTAVGLIAESASTSAMNCVPPSVSRNTRSGDPAMIVFPLLGRRHDESSR